MDILYKIQFYSDWHCGSGLAAGADVDALVVKDKNNLPFIPGKTIKGLLREAIEDIYSFSKVSNERIQTFIQTFGYSTNKEQSTGCAFFTNAEIESDIANTIIASYTHKYLYRAITSTAIDSEGVAKDNSLRRMEVVVPCTLQGRIINIPDNMEEDIKMGLKYIKRLGQNRNRGLGRCKIELCTNQKGDNQ